MGDQHSTTSLASSWFTILKQVPSTEAQACLPCRGSGCLGSGHSQNGISRNTWPGICREEVKGRSRGKLEGSEPCPLPSPMPRVGAGSVTQSSSFHKDESLALPI